MDLLTIKILKGGIKKQYCQDREILGFSENYLKLLQALYYCVAHIIQVTQSAWARHQAREPTAKAVFNAALAQNVHRMDF